jgi:hypothetical protein
MSDEQKRLTRAQENGEAPLPHPLTEEANREPHPGEISDPDAKPAAKNKNMVGEEKEIKTL